MKKAIYVDQGKIKSELQELKFLKDKTNQLFDLLCEFGIQDPDNLDDPVKAVNDHLKKQLPINELEFTVLPKKIAEIVGLDKEYEQLKELSNIVINHRMFDKIRWNKTQFSISSHAKNTIIEDATFYLTEKKQIDLANKIEKFIEEAYQISKITGIKIPTHKMLNLFSFLKQENGKPVIHHTRFLYALKKKGLT
jgi:hypothetical protein